MERSKDFYPLMNLAYIVQVIVTISAVLLFLQQFI